VHETEHILQPARMLANKKRERERETYHIRLHVQCSFPDDRHKRCSKQVKTRRTELKH
jgi:hypothetical protein